MTAQERQFTLRHPEKDVDLGVYLTDLGAPFLGAIIKAFQVSKAGSESLKIFDQRVKALKLFIAHLLKKKPALLSEIQRGDDENGFGERQSWLLFNMSFANNIASKNISNSSKNKHLSGMNFWIKFLQNQGFIPRFNRLSTLKREQKVSHTLLDYIRFDKATDELGENEFDASDKAEARRMMKSIEVELGKIEATAIPQQAAVVIRKRLQAICDVASSHFKDLKGKRTAGLRAIRKYRHLLPLMDRLLGWRRGDGGRSNPHAVEVDALTNEQWWGLFLAWCWYRNDGLEPKDAITDVRIYNYIRKQFQARKDTRADKATAEAIGCCKEWIAAANVLLVHDLCANADSIRKISVNAVVRNSHGINEIHWDKPRGAGAMQLIDNGEHVYRPAAIIRTIRRATRRYRNRCNPSDKDFLFLHHHSSKGWAKKNKSAVVRPMLPSSSTILEQVKNIIREASNDHWSGTTRSIRNSLLLYKGLTGGLISVQAGAQHSDSRTSQLYANKLPMLLMHDQKMLAFREWLETLVTINLDDVPEKLGIDAKAYDERKSDILSSRFGGLYCANPMSGAQPGAAVGEVCTKFSRCLTCGEKRNIFIASLDNVVHLLHWDEALKDAHVNGVIDLNKDVGWLYWKVFIDALLEKLKNDGRKYAAILNDARDKAGTRINPYMRLNFAGAL